MARRQGGNDDGVGVHFRIDPLLLATVDELAERQYTSRAGLLNRILRETFEREQPELLARMRLHGRQAGHE